MSINSEFSKSIDKTYIYILYWKHGLLIFMEYPLARLAAKYQESQVVYEPSLCSLAPRNK